MAERSRLVDDPLNLMRLMPPKEARSPSRTASISAMRFHAYGFFCFADRTNRMDKMSSKKSNGADSVDSVHSVQTQLLNSKKIYLNGKLHPDLRVPFREISLAPTKTMSGEIEVNEPVRVYDTSGPWGDADQHVHVEQGLPSLRAKWIRDR